MQQLQDFDEVVCSELARLRRYCGLVAMRLFVQ